MIHARRAPFAVLCFLAASVHGQAEEKIPQGPPLLTVTGRAEVHLTPDEATLRLGVTRQSKTAREAQKEANRAARKILKATTRLGIDQERIQTSGVQLRPIYAPRKPVSEKEPRIVAYRANYQISFRLAKISLIGRVMDTALEKGANRLEGVRFRLHDDRAAREEALREAVKKASRKAEVMARALGVKLVELVGVEEIGGVAVPRPYAEASRMMATSDAATPISPGQITVTAKVRLRYRIGNRPE